MTTKLRPRKYPTGLVTWALPNTDGLMVAWLGPGCGLMLQNSKPMNAGGMMTRIESRGSDGVYNTLKEAQAAVDTFVARAEEQ